MSWDEVQSTGMNITAAEWNTMVTFIKRTVTTKSGAYTAVNRDIILVDGTVTITLPSPSANDVIDIKNIGSGTVTIDGDGNNIDGDASVYIYNQYESISLVSDGSNWWMI